MKKAAIEVTCTSQVHFDKHETHQMKFRDSAQHLRYIISELEKGFVLNPTIENVETSK